MTTITFINASSTGENDQQTMINRAESSLENIIEILSFWFENGTDKESSEVVDLDLSDIEKQLENEEIDQDEFDRLKNLIDAYDEIGSFYEYGLSFDFVESDENSDGYYRYQLSWAALQMRSDSIQMVRLNIVSLIGLLASVWMFQTMKQ